MCVVLENDSPSLYPPASLRTSYHPPPWRSHTSVTVTHSLYELLDYALLELKPITLVGSESMIDSHSRLSICLSARHFASLLTSVVRGYATKVVCSDLCSRSSKYHTIHRLRSIQIPTNRHSRRKDTNFVSLERRDTSVGSEQRFRQRTIPAVLQIEQLLAGTVITISLRFSPVESDEISELRSRLSRSLFFPPFLSFPPRENTHHIKHRTGQPRATAPACELNAAATWSRDPTGSTA